MKDSSNQSISASIRVLLKKDNSSHHNKSLKQTGAARGRERLYESNFHTNEFFENNTKSNENSMIMLFDNEEDISQFPTCPFCRIEHIVDDDEMVYCREGCISFKSIVLLMNNHTLDSFVCLFHKKIVKHKDISDHNPVWIVLSDPFLVDCEVCIVGLIN
jgi:hypothetical protein